MEKGRVAHSPLFLLRYVQNTSAHSRIAAIVPVKVVKTASGRNKLKRKIYEAVQKVYPRIVSGYTIAILAKATAITADSQSIESDIKDLLIKAKISQ